MKFLVKKQLKQGISSKYIANKGAAGVDGVTVEELNTNI